MIILFGEERSGCFSLLWSVACMLSVMILLTLTLGVIGGLCSVIVAITEHFLYFFK